MYVPLELLISVNKMIGCGLDVRGSVPKGYCNFISAAATRLAFHAASHSIYSVGRFLEVTRSEDEVEHTLPPCVEMRRCFA
jgi:hypothetical protein